MSRPIAAPSISRCSSSLPPTISSLAPSSTVGAVKSTGGGDLQMELAPSATGPSRECCRGEPVADNCIESWLAGVATPSAPIEWSASMSNGDLPEHSSVVGSSPRILVTSNANVTHSSSALRRSGKRSKIVTPPNLPASLSRRRCRPLAAGASTNTVSQLNGYTRRTDFLVPRPSPAPTSPGRRSRRHIRRASTYLSSTLETVSITSATESSQLNYRGRTHTPLPPSSAGHSARRRVSSSVNTPRSSQTADSIRRGAPDANHTTVTGRDDRPHSGRCVVGEVAVEGEAYTVGGEQASSRQKQGTASPVAKCGFCTSPAVQSGASGASITVPLHSNLSVIGTSPRKSTSTDACATPHACPGRERKHRIVDLMGRYFFPPELPPGTVSGGHHLNFSPPQSLFLSRHFALGDGILDEHYVFLYSRS
ncbi:hypothetical protein FB451DRAFT_1176828 [Mycena latifolia]|nr:hypothetical protein FB451DRAFT_1176828 [Mycena latifolia]